MSDNNKVVKTMDPLTMAISAGSSVLGSVINGLFTSHQNKENRKQTNYWNERQLEFNSDEAFKQRTFEADQARRTREFNANEAEKQRIFNEAMWRKENAYNTPSAQLQRLRDAGLNPNLFGGDNTAGSVASSTPASASAPQGAAASAGSLSAYQGAPIQVSNPLMDASIIRLNNAQANKLEEDANRTHEMLPGELKAQGLELDLLGGKINLQSKEGELLDEQVKNVAENTRLVAEKINESSEYQRLLRLQGDEKQKALDHWEERFIKEMRALDDKHLIDAEELNVMASQIKKNLADASNAYAQGRAADARAALDGVQYRIQNKYGMLMARIAYDKANSELKVQLREAELGAKKSEFAKRLAAFRNGDNSTTWMPQWLQDVANYELDGLQLLSESIGLSFGVNHTFKGK